VLDCLATTRIPSIRWQDCRGSGSVEPVADSDIQIAKRERESNFTPNGLARKRILHPIALFSAMTTYVYETIPKKAGAKPRRFEIKQAMQDAPLTHDPESGEPVRRVIAGG
jgi:hypothetical protein